MPRRRFGPFGPAGTPTSLFREGLDMRLQREHQHHGRGQVNQSIMSRSTAVGSGTSSVAEWDFGDENGGRDRIGEFHAGSHR